MSRTRARHDSRSLFVLSVIVVAFGGGFQRILARPVPSTFRMTAPAATPDEAPRFTSRFLTTPHGIQTHAACLVELADGRIRAFWYAGSREGAPDVEIRTSVFDPGRGIWGEERVVADASTTRRSLARYVRKLGNPTAIRTPDGALWLFYVTVSMGGWSGSSITAITSHDEGETWSPAQRLVTSPVFNLSTLVKTAPFLYADGTIGLPAYQELTGSFGELLRLDRSGAVVDRRRLSGAGALQPLILLRSSTEALALLRNSVPERLRRVVATHTTNAGGDWTAPIRLSLSNPDSPLSGVVLPDGRILVVLNDIDVGRDVLSLAVSEDGGVRWKIVRRLEDESAVRNQGAERARYDHTLAALARASDPRVVDPQPWIDSVRRLLCDDGRCRFEFSYPSLLQTKSGELHLVYTWNASFIKHLQFNRAWLEGPANPDAPIH
jgi:predicted neuraminidase